MSFLLLLVLLPACQTPPRQPATSLLALRQSLPELAQAHADKIKLAAYATSFLRHLDPPVQQFAQDMGKTHERLLAQLRAWARAHHVDLTFRYAHDPTGRARQAQEKEQGDQLLADSNADFQRDLLVLMYSDYDWQLNLITALLRAAPDPDLQPYLEDSRRAHEQGLAQIRTLLTRYQWTLVPRP